MRRRPLRSTLFAYTTLFRSVNYEVWDIGKPMARQLLPAPTGVPLMPDVVHWAFHEYGMRVGCWRFHELFTKVGIKDRKSTRLNSSHLGISYAVFCLKKKKKK